MVNPNEDVVISIQRCSGCCKDKDDEMYILEYPCGRCLCKNITEGKKDK